MNRQKGFAPIILVFVGIIVLAIGIGGYILLFQQKQIDELQDQLEGESESIPGLPAGSELQQPAPEATPEPAESTSEYQQTTERVQATQDQPIQEPQPKDFEVPLLSLSPMIQQLQGLWGWDHTIAGGKQEPPEENGYIAFREKELCIMFTATRPTRCINKYELFTASGDEILTGLSTIGQHLYYRGDKIEWHRLRQTGSEKGNDYSITEIKAIYIRLSSKPLD